MLSEHPESGRSGSIDEALDLVESAASRRPCNIVLLSIHLILYNIIIFKAIVLLDFACCIGLKNLAWIVAVFSEKELLYLYRTRLLLIIPLGAIKFSNLLWLLLLVPLLCPPYRVWISFKDVIWLQDVLLEHDFETLLIFSKINIPIVSRTSLHILIDSIIIFCDLNLVVDELLLDQVYLFCVL